MRFVSKLAAFAVQIAMAQAHECVMHATQVTTPIPSAVPEEPVAYYQNMEFGPKDLTLQLGDGQSVATLYNQRLNNKIDIDGEPHGTQLAGNHRIRYGYTEMLQLDFTQSDLSEGQTLSFYSCALSVSFQEYHCMVGVKQKGIDPQASNYRLSLDYFSRGGDDPLVDGLSFDKSVEVYNADNDPIVYWVQPVEEAENFLKIGEYARTGDANGPWIQYSDITLEYYPLCNRPFSEIDRVLGIVLDDGNGNKQKVSGSPHPSYYETIRNYCGWTTETKTFYKSTCTDSIPDNSYYLKVQLAMTLFNITILWYCFVYGYLFPKDLKTIDPPEEELQCEETPTAAGCRDILDDFEEPVIIIDF